MQIAPIDDTPQARTLCAFTVLHHLCPNWGGRLILSLGLNPQGAALALASHTPHATPGAIDAPTLLARLLEERQWHPHDLSFADPAALKHFDTGAIALLPQDDLLRRAWLTSAPRLFPRERPPHRTLWLT